MDLRDCQVSAIACARERQNANESETNLSLCTGAGKSIIMREITGNTERIILVFPWLDLMNQYYNDHKGAYTSYACVRYWATEGRLPGVQRLSATMSELDEKVYVIFTTYTSAPDIFANLTSERSVNLVVHDEAHRTERPEYKASFQRVTEYIHHTVNLSATLPETKVPHYKYPLLRGIKDNVVRDFHMELFLCVAKERSETQLIIKIVEKLLALHSQVKLLIYTAEANTFGADSSSVKTFMDKHAETLKGLGYWIEGINEDTKDRQGLLRKFEEQRNVSILVSCKTLSEGIDLKNANCMLPWDPSSSVKDNIQRIGRVLRLYKNPNGSLKKEQQASTVLIPVFLEEQKYVACNGDKEAINALLCKEISEGERGNFRPIVSVCTALKDELAQEDEELFNRLLNYPYEPKVAVNRNLVECVAKQCKKSTETVLEDVVKALEGKVDEEQLELIKEGEWDEEVIGEVAQALADTQGLTLVVRDGDEADMFGSGETPLTVEKKANEEGYKVVKGKRAEADKEEAKKRIAQRLRVDFSDGCKVLLGINTVEGTDATGGMMLSRLTTEVKYDEDWEKRRLEWISMREKLGRNPSCMAKDIIERRAGQWQQDQRKFYKAQRISEERKQKLIDNTPNWSWKDEDSWEPNRILWISIYSKIGRNPNKHSDDPQEKKAGDWQCNQRAIYRKNNMTLEHISILQNKEETPNWTWEDEDSWELQRQNWISQLKKNMGKYPSKNSTDPEEKKAGQWQGKQRKNYKQKKSAQMTPERIKILNETPGWTWSADEPPQTPYIQPTNELVQLPTPTETLRVRKPLKKLKKLNPEISGQQRQLSQLEAYHQRFKTMNASTYKSSVKAEEFTEYHQIADTYDAKDPPERQPINKIAGLLAKYNKPSYKAIDLGCGKNRLRIHEAVSRMSWTSVDVHAVDETVTIADMSALPFEDEIYDIVVLSRSLWARNHMDVLKEVYRILKCGGRVVVCESFRRWLNPEEETPVNTLVEDLKTAGFEVAYEEGTSHQDTVESVFQYIIVRKC